MDWLLSGLHSISVVYSGNIVVRVTIFSCLIFYFSTIKQNLSKHREYKLGRVELPVKYSLDRGGNLCFPVVSEGRTSGWEINL